MSAWWRSLAMRARTLRNWAAVDAAMARILLFAKLRKALSWAAAWAASLERPFLACSDTLAFLRSLRAFFAFSRIWAAFAAMCELVCLILALVAEARAARARCWLSTAILRLRAAARLFLRMISRVLAERRMVALLRLFWSSAEAANLAWTRRMLRSRDCLARRALMAILASRAFFMEARAAWLYAKLRAMWARIAAMSARRPADSLAICFSTLLRYLRRRMRPSGVFVTIMPAFFTSTDSMERGRRMSYPEPMNLLALGV